MNPNGWKSAPGIVGELNAVMKGHPAVTTPQAFDILVWHGHLASMPDQDRHHGNQLTEHQGSGSRAAWHRHGLQIDRVRPAPRAGHQRAPHMVALVRAGATFNNGKLLERTQKPNAA